MEFTVSAIVDSLKSRSYNGKTYYDALYDSIPVIENHKFCTLETIIENGIKTRSYDNLDSVLFCGAVEALKACALDEECGGAFDMLGAQYVSKFIYEYSKTLNDIIVADDEGDTIFQEVEE